MAIQSIETAPKTGRVLVARGSTIAVASWAGDFWAYSYSVENENLAPVQLDFEPTHWGERSKDFL